MKIKDIVALESDNTGNIILHKEGIFWRAYEKSACLFARHIKPYQIKRKYVKYLNADIVFLGFPQTMLAQLFEAKAISLSDQNERMITLHGFQIDEDDFADWKQSIETKETQMAEEPCVQGAVMPYHPEQAEPKAGQLLETIRKFPVAGKTPLECQQFIIDLQKQLHGTLQ